MVDDQSLQLKTERELGVSDPKNAEPPILLLDRVPANLPAIPDFIPAANRLIADLIDLAALLDRHPDREIARDRMRKRLVRNNQLKDRRVHFAAIEFEPEVQKNGDVHAVAWYSEIPGETKARKVTPLIYIGPEFLKKTQDGTYYSGGSVQCILFKPTTSRGSYKALPLGFADPRTILMWNQATKHRIEDKQLPRPLIQPIQHELRKPAFRRIAFVPHMSRDTHLISEHSSRQYLGNHFGQKVFLAARSKVPVTHTKQLFRIKRFEERWIEVVWLGFADEFIPEDRVSLEDVRHEMDAFEILGTSRLLVDWRTIDQSSRKWLNRAYSKKNPLYVGALNLGLVKESDDQYTKRVELERLWKDAVKFIRLEMIQAAHVAHDQIRQTSKKPTAQEVFQGEPNLESLIAFLNEPEDVIASWMASEVFHRPFDSKSPFLMHLRAWFIHTYIKPQMENYSPASYADEDVESLPDLSEFLEELAPESTENVPTEFDPLRRLDFLIAPPSKLSHNERLDRDGLYGDDPVLPRKSIAVGEWFAPKGSGWDTIYTQDGVMTREEMIRKLQARHKKKPET